MTDNATAMVLASFTADALSLGAHWIYDTGKIRSTFGQIEQITAPLPSSYHQEKERGEFTHYGDQAMILLESIAREKSFSLSAFCSMWQELFTGYRGYVDNATHTTLTNLHTNDDPRQCGSSSTDLGGAARIVPLVFRYRNDLETLEEMTTLQTSMTHNHPATLAGALFIARSAYHILHDLSPAEAMNKAIEAGVADLDLDIRLRASLDNDEPDTEKAISQYGQACSIASALPGAVYLTLRFPNSVEEALIANVMAGGDSAARGLVTGMFLGASLGIKAIPERWLNDMRAYGRISELLETIQQS